MAKLERVVPCCDPKKICEIVLGFSLEYASEVLKNNREAVLGAVKQIGYSSEYI